jgi:hypothetical protein
VTLLHSFRLFSRFLALKKVLKFTKSCENTTCKKMFVISLSSCSRYNVNFKFDQSVFTIHDSPLHQWDQWGWPPINGEPCARDTWWTLDFASAFFSPGVNSRAELVPSPRAYARNMWHKPTPSGKTRNL